MELTTTGGALTEEDEPEDLTTMPEALTEDVEGKKGLKISGRQERLRCRNDDPEELETETKALKEEDKPMELDTATEA